MHSVARNFFINKTELPKMTTDLLFKNGLDFFFSIEQQFLVSRHQTGRCLEKKVFYLNVNHKHFNFKLVFFLWRKKISPTLRSVMPSTTNLMLAENAICVVLWRQQKNAHATNSECVQTSHDFLCRCCCCVVVNRLLLYHGHHMHTLPSS